MDNQSINHQLEKKSINYQLEELEELNNHQLEKKSINYQLEELNNHQLEKESINHQLEELNNHQSEKSINFQIINNNYIKLYNLYKHLNKINNIKNNIEKKVEYISNLNRNNTYLDVIGKNLYKNSNELRDLATFMEHPESYSFYYKYMKNWDKFKKVIIIMELYEMISNFLYQRDPLEQKHNSYHKLALLNIILKNQNLMKILIKKIDIK
jgi:DNA repair ATPase RecN